MVRDRSGRGSVYMVSDRSGRGSVCRGELGGGVALSVGES